MARGCIDKQTYAREKQYVHRYFSMLEHEALQKQTQQRHQDSTEPSESPVDRLRQARDVADLTPQRDAKQRPVMPDFLKEAIETAADFRSIRRDFVLRQSQVNQPQLKLSPQPSLRPQAQTTAFPSSSPSFSSYPVSDSMRVAQAGAVRPVSSVTLAQKPMPSRQLAKPNDDSARQASSVLGRYGLFQPTHRSAWDKKDSTSLSGLTRRGHAHARH